MSEPHRQPKPAATEKVSSKIVLLSSVDSMPLQHSTSRQLFKDDDSLHPQRCRARNCVRASRDHTLVPIPVHYSPYPYDADASHTRLRMRSEDFFEPNHVPG